MRLFVPCHCLAPVYEWQQWVNADEVVICIGNRFQKSGWNNRYRIAASNGPLLLTIPVVGGRGNRLPMHKVKINYSERWPLRHVHSLRAAYGKSPFYAHFQQAVEGILLQRWDHLWELNLRIMQLCMQLLQLSIPINLRWEPCVYQPPPPLVPVQYRQVFMERHGFIANLSIIDLLCNHGPWAVMYLRSTRQDPFNLAGT